MPRKLAYTVYIQLKDCADIENLGTSKLGHVSGYLTWTGMLKSMQKECLYLLIAWCSGAALFATIINVTAVIRCKSQ